MLLIDTATVNVSQHMWISEKLACFPNITARIFFFNVFTTLMLSIIVYNVCCDTELKPKTEDGNAYNRYTEKIFCHLITFGGREQYFLDTYSVLRYAF